MKHLLIIFLLACGCSVSAEIPQVAKLTAGADTVMIQTVYTDLNGKEHTRPVKTLRVTTNSRSGTTTQYYSLDPAVLDSHVRRRIISESTK